MNTEIDINDYSVPIMSKVGSKFSKWRPYQAEVVKKIVESDKPYIVLSAPTGSGKSLIAVESALRIYGDVGGAFYYLVNTKDLQEQLLRDFKFFKLLKGRSNFDCKMFKGLKVSECPYQFVRQECPIKNDCDYYVHKKDAMESMFVVWNYSMFLTNQTFVRDFDEVPFMVCDEAHTIEGVLMNFVNVSFNFRFFHELGLNFPREENVLERIDEAYAIVEDRLERFKMSKLLEIMSEDLKDKQEFKEMVELERMRKKIKFFLNNYDENWVIDYRYNRWEVEKSEIVFKPIFVDRFAHLLFDWSYDKILFMSATIPPIDVFAKSLGISEDNIEFIEIPSVFKRENRPVIFEPVGNMAYKYWENDINNVIDWIINFLLNHPEDKVLIHTANYKIARHLAQALEYYQNEMGFEHEIIVTEPDEANEVSLKAFKESEYPAVLISPVFETGIDLPYDSCRYQIIVKVPYLSLADKQVKARLEKDRRWYLSMTANRLVQMAGRIVRAEDDWGVTYVLDENFRRFIVENQDLFPKWFLDAIAVRKNSYRKEVRNEETIQENSTI